MIPSLNEQYKDIDWFCIINNYPIHVASAGGVLPQIMRKRDYNKKIKENHEIIKTIQVSNAQPILNPNLKELIFKDNSKNITNPYIFSVLEIFDVNINEDSDPLQKYIEEIYASSFIEFAKKGFYSFDKTNIDDPLDCMYHLVAAPAPDIELNIEGLILPRIQINDFQIDNHSFNLIELINNNPK